jgi:putative addiction module component (TIGR02574 family)
VGDGDVDYSQVLSAANSLSIDDRIRLVEAIWEGIEGEAPMPELTEAQKQELDRRLAEHEANPDDVIPWEQVKADIEGRFRG